MSDLDRAILERHSPRMFLPAPSGAPGGCRRSPRPRPARAVDDHEAPHIPALPKAFEHYRYELGAAVYGSMGITITDTARHAAAVMRNFDFFRAPLAGIVCMHRDLGPPDALSVGM